MVSAGPKPHSKLRKLGGTAVGALCATAWLTLIYAILAPGPVFGLGAEIEASVQARDRDRTPTPLRDRAQQPEPEPDPREQLRSNPIMASEITLPDVTCELPALGRSKEGLRRYYEAAIECFDKAWHPVLEKHDLVVSTPVVTFNVAESACGEAPDEDEAVAFYCSGRIFMPRERVLDAFGTIEAGHLWTLAHEYGHHVQWMTEQLWQAAALRSDLAKSEERLEVTRRMELQANCFAGMSLGSVAGRGSVSSEMVDLMLLALSKGSPSDTHGSPENRSDWAEAGLKADSTAACNTWTAPDKNVR